MSGDWRPVAGHHELAAVLSVNTPGFATPRTFTTRGRITAMTGLNPVPRPGIAGDAAFATPHTGLSPVEKVLLNAEAGRLRKRFGSD